MVTRERVEAVIERVRPFLQADGGDIQVINVEGGAVGVRLIGVCARCPSAHITLHMGIEAVLRDEVPDFESLHLV
jgi:Fe-S cluster biogenesis protein NfuA